MLALGLLSTADSVVPPHDGGRPTSTPAARRVDPVLQGPTARLTIEPGSSANPQNVRAELFAEGRSIGRYDGPLPTALVAPRDVPLVLVLEAPGRARHLERLVLTADHTLRIDLGPGFTLAGQAVDERGAPVRGASVRATRTTGPAEPWIARTDDDGRFTIDTLLPGTYRVEASARGHSRTSIDAEAGTDELLLTLERVGLVAGRVVRPDGRGAEGATVIIAGSGLWPARRTTAGEDGRFRIADVPPGIYEVRAFAGDLVAEPRRGLEIEPGSPAYLTFGLSQGMTLRGVLRDSETGRPIAGAEVTVSTEALDAAPRAATSDADGRFTVRGLASDGPGRVSVFAPGYVPIAALEHDPTRPLELELEPAATLEGIVLDEHRQPLEGAIIEIVGETLERQPVALGPDAAFRSAVFASQLEPSVVPAGLAALEVTEGPVPPIPTAPTSTELPFAPLPTSAAEARVSASFVSDAEGRFRVTGIPPGHVQVLARRAGRAPAASARFYVGAGALRDGIELVLPPAGRLRGLVRDARGEGVDGVLVEVRSDREPFPRVAISADRGEFELDAVSGELTVTATPHGRPAVRASITVEPSQVAELTLTLEGELHTLSGRTVDEAGFPVPGAQLVVLSLRADAPFRRTFFAAEDGTFTLSELPAPPWRLEASAPAFAPTRIDVADASGELPVVLAPGAEVRGSVLDAYSGEPVDARVRLVRDALPPDVHEMRTARDGSFRFARVTTGAWLLTIESEGHLPFERAVEITRRGRAPADVDLDAIRLEPAGTVEGAVVDALGAVVARARVWIDENGASARTDTRGEFVLRGAPPGMVTVRASHPAAGESASAPVRVLAGRETPGVVVRLPERFDADRAAELPGLRRGVALSVEQRGGEVRVRHVIARSHAERSGLRAGDVLEQIDGIAPESATHAAALLRGAPGTPAVLVVRRGDTRATVLVERESWLPP